MNRRTQKRWALFVLVVWMPVYITLCIVAVNWLFDRWGRAPVWVELTVYVTLGLLAVLPFKRVFQGIGREGE